jgi:hypothetical protein
LFRKLFAGQKKFNKRNKSIEVFLYTLHITHYKKKWGEKRRAKNGARSAPPENGVREMVREAHPKKWRTKNGAPKTARQNGAPKMAHAKRRAKNGARKTARQNGAPKMAHEKGIFFRLRRAKMHNMLSKKKNVY